VEDLDALKSNPGVLRVYAQYVSLKKAGDKYVGKCPFPEHRDSSPSFTVFSDMRASCFGCGANMNIFQLVMKMDGCDFKTAVKKVKAEVGETSWEQAKQKVESTFKPVSEPKTYKTITLEQFGKLESALKESQDAIRFLQEQRGISLPTAQRLHVGFVQNLGSLAGADGADISGKGWLAFPSIEDGKVVSVKYRSVARKKPGGFARQPGMATALWNVETISPFDAVYVVEGEFDVLALEQAGFKAVSVPSAGAKLTPEMKDKLMQASLVILAGDADAAGTASMDKLWKELSERCYKLTWPDGAKDANQCFLDICGRDLARFTALAEDLTRKAKSQPMPSVYSLQETLLNGEQVSLSDHPNRLRFPWPAADAMVNVMPGDVLGIGATNTGMAKTTLVTQITMYNARRFGRCILNYQTEMRPDEIATMVAAQVLRKDRNFLGAEDKKAAAKEIEGVEYYIGCDPMLSDINAVLDLLEAAIKRLSPYCVVLDHFHHLTTGMDNETKVQSAAMTRIKQMAQTYGVIFINVGQPRKATQQTKGKQIHITDFKGSGAWGDAANAVMAIHRDLNKSDDPTTAKGVYEDKTLLKVLKGRSMGTGPSACYLTFFGEFASFEQVENNYEEPPE
jgi:hypothetical protein